jgi:hypothetical protein
VSALIPIFEVLRLDAELVRIGRGSSALRLAVGEGLAALSAKGGHHELGFSSLDAYARERCERSGRWAADTRALALALGPLRGVRGALCEGVIGWSTAELLARHVEPSSELEWLERARTMTVRELREELARRNDNQDVSSNVDAGAEDEEARRSLTVSVLREDAWLFEGARKVAEAVAGAMPVDRLLQTLLAEGYSTLLEVVPKEARSELLDIERVEHQVSAESQAQAAWRAELARFRSEAEKCCEARTEWLADGVPDRVEEEWLGFSPSNGEPERVEEEWPGFSPSMSAEELDREIRRLCSELAGRDLALGIVAESAKKAEVWRRLGYATEAQYARERVGVSLSSLKARRTLAARAGRVPELAEALAGGRLGYEAAYLLSRVVTPNTVEAWIRRAERRTLKHLRQEVEAAELLMRTGLGREQEPLDEPCLEEVFELERSISSGDFGESTASNAKPAGGQISGARRATPSMRRFGRVTLRWLVREETARWFRALERVFLRVSARVCRVPASFLRFLCDDFCRIWLPALRHERLTESGELSQYFRVYRRDGFRCASPVCTRRDLTPHHLLFRSRGGGDDDENVASLCVFCHLHGVHEGRITAEPPASRIRWTIGRTGTLRVDGRVRSLVHDAQ